MSMAGGTTKTAAGGHSSARRPAEILRRLGVADAEYTGGALVSRSPIDGSQLAQVRETPAKDVAAAVGKAHEAFLAWRLRPCPAARRAGLRRFGEILRWYKEELALVVSLEVGKITRKVWAKCRR